MVSYKGIALCLAMSVFFAMFAAYFFFHSGFMLIIGSLFALFSACYLACIFCFPNYIKYDGERITVANTPFFATNKFLFGKRGLIEWNCNIFVDEIESVELVLLSHDEKVTYYGFSTVFNEYLKINIKNSNKSKFIYTAIYSRKQYEKLLDAIDFHSKMTNHKSKSRYD